MKKSYFLLIVLMLVFEITQAQTQDSIVKKFRRDDNYYGLFHKAIHNGEKNEVSEIAIFIGSGLGLVSFGVGASLESMIAYRSHVLNYSRFHGIDLPIGNLDRIKLSHSFTFGESFRDNSFLCSVSTGIALNSYSGYTPIPKGTNPVVYDLDEYKGKNVISVPIEFRAYFLAINGIGMGGYVNFNFISNDHHTNYIYAGLNLVLGYWNKPKRSFPNFKK